MPLGIFYKKIDEEGNSQKEYIEQLFKMAHTDGHMDESEYHFILKVAQRLEVEVDFEFLHNNLHNLSFDGTSNKKFGFELLFDLSWLMLVDGEADHKEMLLGTEIATQMGFLPKQVEQMVSAIIEQKKLGRPPEEIREKLKPLFDQKISDNI